MENSFVSLDRINKEYSTMIWKKEPTICKVLAIRIFPISSGSKGSFNCTRERGEDPLLRVRLKERKKTGELEVDISFPLGLLRNPRFEEFKPWQIKNAKRDWGVWGHIPLSIEQAKKLGKALLEHAKPSSKDLNVQ